MTLTHIAANDVNKCVIKNNTVYYIGANPDYNITLSEIQNTQNTVWKCSTPYNTTATISGVNNGTVIISYDGTTITTIDSLPNVVINKLFTIGNTIYAIGNNVYTITTQLNLYRTIDHNLLSYDVKNTLLIISGDNIVATVDTNTNQLQQIETNYVWKDVAIKDIDNFICIGDNIIGKSNYIYVEDDSHEMVKTKVIDMVTANMKANWNVIKYITKSDAYIIGGQPITDNNTLGTITDELVIKINTVNLSTACTSISINDDGRWVAVGDGTMFHGMYGINNFEQTSIAGNWFSVSINNDGNFVAITSSPSSSSMCYGTYTSESFTTTTRYVTISSYASISLNNHGLWIAVGSNSKIIYGIYGQDYTEYNDVGTIPALTYFNSVSLNNNGKYIMVGTGGVVIYGLLGRNQDGSSYFQFTRLIYLDVAKTTFNSISLNNNNMWVAGSKSNIIAYGTYNTGISPTISEQDDSNWCYTSINNNGYYINVNFNSGTMYGQYLNTFTVFTDDIGSNYRAVDINNSNQFVAVSSSGVLSYGIFEYKAKLDNISPIGNISVVDMYEITNPYTLIYTTSDNHILYSHSISTPIVVQTPATFTTLAFSDKHIVFLSSTSLYYMNYTTDITLTPESFNYISNIYLNNFATLTYIGNQKFVTTAVDKNNEPYIVVIVFNNSSEVGVYKYLMSTVSGTNDTITSMQWIDFVNDKFVGVSPTNIYVSDTAKTFDRYISGVQFKQLTLFNNVYYGFNASNNMYKCNDDITRLRIVSNLGKASSAINALCSNSDYIAFVGSNGYINVMNEDGNNVAVSSDDKLVFVDATLHDDVLDVLSNDGKIYYVDLTDKNPIVKPVELILNSDIVVSGFSCIKCMPDIGGIAAVGDNVVAYSVDGVSYVVSYSPIGKQLLKVTSNNKGRMFAIDDKNVIEIAAKLVRKT